MNLVSGYILGLLMIFLVLVTGTLGGCVTTQARAAVDMAGDEVADAADLAHGTARRIYCDGATMGAIRRAYMGRPEALRAYLNACGWETWPTTRSVKVK